MENETHAWHDYSGAPERLDFKPIFNKEVRVDPKTTNPGTVFGKRPRTQLTARPPQHLVKKNRPWQTEQQTPSPEKPVQPTAQDELVQQGSGAAAVNAEVEPPVVQEVSPAEQRPSMLPPVSES